VDGIVSRFAAHKHRAVAGRAQGIPEATMQSKKKPGQAGLFKIEAAS
jgi:hypothetical protein